MSIQSHVGKSYWFDLSVADDVDARSFYQGLINRQFLLMKDSPVASWALTQFEEERSR